MIIIKKLLFVLLVVMANIVSVRASETVKARIGDKYFDTLEDAIMMAGANDTIVLVNDVSLKETMDIQKTVNINLNNNNIEGTEKVFLVQGGSLNLSGKGRIVETSPNYGAIMLKGSDEALDTNYSTVSVGEDVELEGWSGIFVNHNNNTAYGVVVNMNGKIKAVDDINGGPGVGVYVNGNIKHENNSPVINIGDSADITSTGNGIYAAGYGVYNIDGATIRGSQSGLGIKAGVFNIKNSTIIGFGKDETPTSGNNNGINASGTAIQIESNPGYKGNVELNISSGNISSKYSNVIYEYTTKGASTQVKSIDIKGGTYISEAEKEVFSLSDSFKNKHSKFISGGSFSSNPSSYLDNGYSANLNSKDLYEVTLSTMQVFRESDSSNNNFLGIFIVTIIVGILGFIIYKYLRNRKIFI